VTCAARRGMCLAVCRAKAPELRVLTQVRSRLPDLQQEAEQELAASMTRAHPPPRPVPAPPNTEVSTTLPGSRMGGKGSMAGGVHAQHGHIPDPYMNAMQLRGGVCAAGTACSSTQLAGLLSAARGTHTPCGSVSDGVEPPHPTAAGAHDGRSCAARGCPVQPQAGQGGGCAAKVRGGATG
jgi:hypothetical protein